MAYKTKEGKWMCDLRPRLMGKPAGQRVRRLMPKVRTRAEAEEEERRILRDIQAELSGERKVSPTFEEFAKGEYLRWARGNKKRADDDERKVAMLCDLPHFAKKRLDEITPDHIEAFKRDRRQATTFRGHRIAPGTVNTELAIVSAVFRVAVANGKARSNPVLAVSYLTADARRYPVLEYDEEPRLMEALAHSRPHMKPLAQIALLTGMRLGELLNLRVEDVDFGRDVLRVRDPKWAEDKRKTEGIPFSREVRDILLSLKVRRGLFFTHRTGRKLRQGSVSAMFGYWAERAGLPDITFHSLRHTFGTRLAKAGRPVEDIMRLMGHASPTMSLRYIHPTEVDLRAAVEGLSERPKVIEFPQTGQRAGGEG